MSAKKIEPARKAAPKPKAVETDITPVVANQVAESAQMLADSSRILILNLLSTGEYDVKTITDRINSSQPATSSHLAVLRLAKAVTSVRDGRRAIYSITGYGRVLHRFARSMTA